MVLARLIFAWIYFRECKFSHILRGFIFTVDGIIIISRGLISVVAKYVTFMSSVMILGKKTNFCQNYGTCTNWVVIIRPYFLFKMLKTRIIILKTNTLLKKQIIRADQFFGQQNKTNFAKTLFCPINRWICLSIILFHAFDVDFLLISKFQYPCQIRVGICVCVLRVHRYPVCFWHRTCVCWIFLSVPLQCC